VGTAEKRDPKEREDGWKNDTNGFTTQRKEIGMVGHIIGNEMNESTGVHKQAKKTCNNN